MSKADVAIYSVGGRRVAVKDYETQPFIVHHLVGHLLIRRECRAYLALAGAAGTAPFLGRLGPFALATGWVDARPLADRLDGTAAGETFDRLDAVIAGLHARGVAIADLHHRDVLIGADGAVHVVDFAAAFVLGPHPGSFRRRVFERLTAHDRLAAARMRGRYTGRPEDEALAGIDSSTVRLWGIGRAIKGFWNRLRGSRD